MKIPLGLEVPANVKDSLDEALAASERLAGHASEALKEAGRTAFDQSFVVILAGVAVLFVIAALVIGWAGARSKQKGTGMPEV